MRTVKKPNVKRTPERLIRLAYEMEYLAKRLHDAGHENECNGVNDIASRLGKIGRAFADKLGV